MHKKQILKVLASLSLGLSIVSTSGISNVFATNFEGNENRYYKLCSSKTLDSVHKQTCKEFNSYLKNKSKDIKKEISDAKKAIEDTQQSVDEIVKQLNEIEANISKNTATINYVDASIKTTQTEIDTKQKELKERLYAIQSQINSNIYYDYLLGASSFSEFFSRASTIGDLTSYETNLMNEIKTKQDDLKNQQATLKNTKAALDVQKQAAKKEKQTLYSKVTGQKANLASREQQLSKNTESIELIASNMKDLEAAEKATKVTGITKAIVPKTVATPSTSTTTNNTPTKNTNNTANQQTNKNTKTTNSQPATNKSNSATRQNNTPSNTTTTQNKTSNTNTSSQTKQNTSTATTSTSSAELGIKIANLALSKQGCEYRWGYSGPSIFDCSGLVYWAHKSAGVSIGRTTAAVYSGSGKAVSRSQMQPGDVITFINNEGKVHHIGIYIGGNKMVHAPHSGATVSVVNLSGSYWQREWYRVRRLY